MKARQPKSRQPSARSAGGRARRLLLALACAALACAGGSVAWRHETTSVKLTAGTPRRHLVVPPGSNAESIGRSLYAMGLTLHPAVFRVLASSRGVSTELKAGHYALDGPLSLEQILDKLVRGEIVRRALTVPEGRSIAEIAGIARAQGLDGEAFLAAARDATAIRDLDPAASDLEGYLFPDTYEVPQSPEAARVLVNRMLQRFRSTLAPLLGRIGERGLSLRQVVTVASIVELETGQAGERARIAAVFLNRLRKGMLLQTDPTVIYAMKKAGRWNGNIRRDDLLLDSPYNTYRHAGLPPGPIGCPGREAILAVIDPAQTNELYFVSRNDGTHQFSETLADHNRAVNKYQRRRARS